MYSVEEGSSQSSYVAILNETYISFLFAGSMLYSASTGCHGTLHGWRRMKQFYIPSVFMIFKITGMHSSHWWQYLQFLCWCPPDSFFIIIVVIGLSVQQWAHFSKFFFTISGVSLCSNIPLEMVWHSAFQDTPLLSSLFIFTLALGVEATLCCHILEWFLISFSS